MSAKDSESSDSKNSAETKGQTIADSEKEKSVNDNSGEVISAKVKKEDNSVNDIETKISEGTQHKDSISSPKITKNISK